MESNEFEEWDDFTQDVDDDVLSEESLDGLDHFGDLLDSTEEPPATWAVSVCFWSTLTVAAMLYGAVALTPKLSVWMSVRSEYRENTRQLIMLEEKVDYLERVARTLETDADFADRMARASGAVQPTDDSSDLMPVSGNLRYGYDDSIPDVNLTPQPSRHAAVVRHLGSNKTLRSGILILAAGLTIFAFALLNDAGAGIVEVCGRAVRTVLRLPAQRYAARVSESHSSDVR